jgi:hypothetical protein
VGGVPGRSHSGGATNGTQEVGAGQTSGVQERVNTSGVQERVKTSGVQKLSQVGR